MKYYVEVVFAGGQKRYLYKTNLELEVGKYYNIEADNCTRYKNPVKVVQKSNFNEYFFWSPFEVREITKAASVKIKINPKDTEPKITFSPQSYTFKLDPSGVNFELLSELLGDTLYGTKTEAKSDLDAKVQRIRPCLLKNNPIKKVVFNYKKGITTVLWKDGAKTMLKLHPDDKFDEEKAIALAYMKRYIPGGYTLNEVINDTLENSKLIY